MGYVQHTHHEQGYAPPSAVPPPPRLFRDGFGPPAVSPHMHPPPPHRAGYQSYFDDGYPPPLEHTGHYQSWDDGRNDIFCSSFLNTCMATLCCCCLLDQCCWCCY